jgi:hypothetical protein
MKKSPPPQKKKQAPQYKIKSPPQFGSRYFGTIATFVREWGIAERGIYMAIHSNVN